MLQIATTLEGITRHTGIHAAGIIIAPGDLFDYLPVTIDRATGLLVTQYDGSVVEGVGMLKMDLLGLKTLSIIKDTIALIKESKKQEIDIKKIPLDDPKTFALYQQGATIAIFQFESEGMREWLPKLQPTHIQDLVAMNALYRPGPMQFIPNFIARKHGKEAIEYPHPLLEELLKPTYGIMVYQEQIMKTAQIIAGYTLGQADILRKAMGKKKVKEMDEQRIVFIQGAQAQHQIPKEQALEIFSIMEKFAQYGFNLSHSVAYSLIAYQAAYLKTNHPAEYMAAVLTHNQQDMTKLAILIAECSRMGLKIEGADINESGLYFSPSTPTTIRFGLAAIKGVGETAAKVIIAERQKRGPYQDIFDLYERIPPGDLKKKTVESLALAGALDSFKLHRRQYLYSEEEKPNLIEKLLRYTHQVEKTKQNTQQSLFSNNKNLLYGKPPTPPICPPYNKLEKLTHEKELLGYYISGHPLDDYRTDLTHFCQADTQSVWQHKEKEVTLAGIVTQVVQRQTKGGKPYLHFTIEDYQGTLPLALFKENYHRYHTMIVEGATLYFTLRIQKRYGQANSWEITPIHISPLQDIRRQKTKWLQIALPVDRIAEETFVEELSKTLAAYPGQSKIQLLLIDSKGKRTLPFIAKRYQVRPTNLLLNTLVDKMNLSYKLLSKI